MLARPPFHQLGDNLRILIGGILPGEVTGVDQVEIARGQPLMETRVVARWHRPVQQAADDLHRRLDLAILAKTRPE
jgi:hypothetical protein